MEERRLDNELQRIETKLPFLWKSYGFHVKYFTRDYGIYYRGFLIGIENDVCKIIFEKESSSSNEPITLYVGKKDSPFAPQNYTYLVKDGWYILTGLLYWATGVECEHSDNEDIDLENVSQYVQLYIERLIDLFKVPDEFDKKLASYRDFYKEKQISVEQIHQERIRLEALGLDSSLESAVTSLRGGKK